MRNLAIQRRSLDLAALAGAGWRWWTGELLAMLPEGIAQALRGGGAVTIELRDGDVLATDERGAVLLRLPRQEIEGARLPPALRDRLAGARIVVRLPQQQVLRRAVSLPFAARRDLRRILDFELERQSPIDPEQIYADHRISHRDRRANKLKAEMRIIRRETVDNALALCRALGLDASGIVIGGEEASAAESEFRPPRGLLARPRPRSRAVPALAAAAAALAAAAIIVPLIRYDAAVTALAAEVAEAKSAARATEALARQIGQEREKASFVLRQKEAPLLAKVLAEVARRLPDGSWIFQFEMQGREVRIHGYSPQASSLIGLFDGAPFFANARFRSPLTRAAKGDVERFDLSFEVTEQTS